MSFVRDIAPVVAAVTITAGMCAGVHFCIGYEQDGEREPDPIDAAGAARSVMLVTDATSDQLVRRATVTYVVDGDTLDAKVELGYLVTYGPTRFRLLGIDTPELRGAERERGLVARARLADLLDDDASIWIRGGVAHDSFGRWLVDVRLLDGRDPVEILRAEGHTK